MDARLRHPMPMCTASGDPLTKQRRKVQSAMKRGKISRRVRCAIGVHNAPHDKWFNEMGAVIIGGTCSACSDQTLRELTWIGNSWDFKGAGKVNEVVGYISLSVDASALLPAVHAHIDYLHA